MKKQVFDYIKKPFDIDALRIAMKSALSAGGPSA